MSNQYSYEVDLEDLNTSHSLAVLSVRPGSRVLDIGAADGSVARVLVARGCRVSAVEMDEGLARRASLVCEDVATGDIEHLDLDQAFAGRRFDVVLLLDVLEHLRDPPAVLKRAGAVLVPGGRVIASIPNVAHGAVRLSLLRGSFSYTETGLLDRTHLRFFDHAAVEVLFREAGLTIRECLRVTRGLNETEIPIDPQAFPPAVLNEVTQDPESTTYQFVIVAEHDDESDPAAGNDSLAERLQRRLLAAERRFREVEAYARSVAQALAAREQASPMEQALREADSRRIEELTSELVARMEELRRCELELRHSQADLAVKEAFLSDLRVESSRRIEELTGELGARTEELGDLRVESSRRIEELESELGGARRVLTAPSVRLVMAISARLGRFPRLREFVRRLVRRVSIGMSP